MTRKERMRNELSKKIDLKFGNVDNEKSIELYREKEIVDKVVKKNMFDEIAGIINSNVGIVAEKLGDLNYVRETLRNLNLRVQYFTLEMAMLMYLVLENRWYKVWGFSTLEEYASKELNFTPRKAEMLARIYEYYGIELGHTPEIGKRLCEFGWAKMSLLVGVVNETNIDYWVNEAKKTLPELRKSVIQYKLNESSKRYFDESDKSNEVNKSVLVEYNSNCLVDKNNNSISCDKNNDSGIECKDSSMLSGSVESEKFVLENVDSGKKEFVSYKRVFFDVTDEQLGIIDKALHLASKVTDNVNRGYLLSLICLSYLSEFTSNGDVDLKVFFKKLENMLNIKLIAIKDYVIIFGDDFVEEVILK